MSKSRWYEESAQVIRRTLAGIPASATPAQVRRAVREAYPFGLRVGWPYKMWCRAQRDALEARLGTAVPNVVPEDTRPRLFWRHRRVDGRRVLYSGPEVVCRTCLVQPAGGIACIFCRDKRLRWAALWEGRDVAAAFQAALDDPSDAAMLADFVADEFPALVERLKAFHEVPPCKD